MPLSLSLSVYSGQNLLTVFSAYHISVIFGRITDQSLSFHMLFLPIWILTQKFFFPYCSLCQQVYLQYQSNNQIFVPCFFESMSTISKYQHQFYLFQQCVQERNIHQIINLLRNNWQKLLGLISKQICYSTCQQLFEFP